MTKSINIFFGLGLLLSTFSVAQSQERTSESQQRARVTDSRQVQVRPSAQQSILEMVKADDRLQKFSDLSSLLPSLQANLAATGPFTVFAPTDAAFSRLPYELIEELMQEQNREQLAGVLNYHVVAGYYPLDSLQDGQQLRTLAGVTLEVTKTVGTISINEALVETSDQSAINGLVHVIEAVLLPLKNEDRK